LLVGLPLGGQLWGVKVGRGDRQGKKPLIRKALASTLHCFHIRHGIPDVGHGRALGPQDPTPMASKPLGQPQQSRGIRFVRGISHRHQRRVAKAKPFLQQETGRRGLGTADKSPSDGVLRKVCKEVGSPQQGLLPNETLPTGRWSAGIPTEVVATEHLCHLL
jgi:hypothetical protein